MIEPVCESCGEQIEPFDGEVEAFEVAGELVCEDCWAEMCEPDE